MEADLEERLKELEEAKQRQVRQILSNIIFCVNFFCVNLNHDQIMRKTELQKEKELVAAEVKEKIEFAADHTSQVKIISGIIGQLPNSCPSVDPDHASGQMEN